MHLFIGHERIILRLAAIYNLIWGLWVGLFPQHFFELVGMELVNHEVIWQGMGMVIGVYGIGYWIASYHPLKHWPIVLVGLLGKLFGPLGFFIQYANGAIPFGFFYTLISNDFIWWIPFLAILSRAKREGYIRLLNESY